MFEQSPPQTDETAAAADAPEPSGKSSLFGKLKVVGFVTVVIVVECLLACLWLPDAEETVAMASATLEAEPTAESLLEAEAVEEDAMPVADQREVDLGQFSVTAFQPISNTTLRIDFHLFGTVGTEDEQLLLALIEENQHRFREQVLVTMRSADMNDLTDAGLGLIKRKILEKTNRMFGKPLLRAVIFSDFSFIEQ
jgi:flagellar FliL protein